MKVGEVRSLVCESINVMALTATATCAVRHDVECVLGMKKPTIVVISPSKANIYYCVRKNDSMVDAFIPMLEQLRILRCDFPRTLIYCRKFSDCGDLYTCTLKISLETVLRNQRMHQTFHNSG